MFTQKEGDVFLFFVSFSACFAQAKREVVFLDPCPKPQPLLQLLPGFLFVAGSTAFLVVADHLFSQFCFSLGGLGNKLVLL